MGPASVKALAAAVARSWSVTTFHFSSPLLPGDTHQTVISALHRGRQNRRILAFIGALVPGRKRSRTPAERFVWADGDFSLGHRIAEFLVEG
jgi:hypothetical protein